MFFVEPPRSPYDVHFNIGGVPVRIHWAFWLVTLILGASVNPEPVGVLLWVVAELICIIIHELGHVLAFRYYEIESHIVLYGFGGLTIPTSALGGYVRARRDWIANVVISLAGPVAGFVFAALILAALKAAGTEPQVSLNPYTLVGMYWNPLPNPHVDSLIRYMQWINVFWGLMNLLPIFPLDGGQVARAVCERLDGSDGLRRSLWLSIYAGVGMAIFSFVRLNELYMALMFGYLAYQSYQILQQISGMGRGGGRW